MLIALDYGKTYTSDPFLWEKFIACAKERGHEVVCVTMRAEKHGAGGISVEVIYTDGEKKLPYMTRLGRKVDIWIDDWPSTIG